MGSRRTIAVEGVVAILAALALVLLWDVLPLSWLAGPVWP